MLTTRCPNCGDPISLVTSERTVVRCPKCRVVEEGLPQDAYPSPEERAEPIRGLAKATPFHEHWVLGQLLGAGAAGVVFHATPRSGGAAVALKVLSRPEHSSDIARFQREAALLAQFAHPNVVNVLAAGMLGGHPYLALEWMEGGTLRQRVHAASLAIRDALRLGKGILSGLEAIHAAGVVHRDLKPENVLFDGAGVVKIGDFGIAKATQDIGMSTRTGALIGTPRYMAPEQIRGKAASVASDIYAVGITLYEAILGGLPHLSDNLYDLQKDIVERPAVPLADAADGVPAELSALIDRAMAKDPAARPKSAAEFAAELERIEASLNDETSRGRAIPRALLADIGAPAATRIASARQRSRTAYVALAVMVALGGVFAGWLTLAPSVASTGTAVSGHGNAGGARSLASWWTNRDVELLCQSVSPRLLAVAGEKGEIGLLDASGTALRGLQGPVMEPEGLALSPEGRLLAAADKGHLNVWDMDAGAVLWKLELVGFGGVAFAGGSRWLATAGREATVRLWDAQTGAPVREFSADARVRELTQVVPGNLLAVLTELTATVHDPATGKVLATLPTPRGRTFAASPDGARLAIAGDSAIVPVVEWRSGRTLAQLKGNNGHLQSVAWSPDGQKVATSTREGRIASYDAASGLLLGERNVGHKVEALAFERDNRTLVGASGKSLERWQIENAPGFSN